MNNEERDQKLAASPSGHRLTPEGLQTKVAKAEYIRHGETLTICVLTMRNGFQIVGKSACADPKNYNQELGEKIAYDDAFRQLWPLEGYALRDFLASQEAEAA